MSQRVAISVSGVSKSFQLPHERVTTLKQGLGRLLRPRPATMLKAVEHVSFDVRPGEFFGIIGRNGCGKSTLLKMLAGIYVPTSGQIETRGTLSPFIELGVGFNPELSARDNIFLNGSILGFTRNELRKRFDDIIGFAELEPFVDQKLKNFSSGMHVRLAFSIAVQVPSDILLIDEVLAVGDSAFQKKCYDVFHRMKAEGRTIVFVTHGMESMRQFCDRVLVMHEGRSLGVMGPDEGANLYERLNAENAVEQAIVPQGADEAVHDRWGSGRVSVDDVQFLDASGQPAEIFRTGEPFTVRLHLSARSAEDRQLPVSLGLAFHATDGTFLAGPNSADVVFSAADERIDYHLDRAPFAEGTYLLTTTLSNPGSDEVYDFQSKRHSFGVIGMQREYGLTHLFGSWKTVVGR